MNIYLAPFCSIFTDWFSCLNACPWGKVQTNITKWTFHFHYHLLISSSQSVNNTFFFFSRFSVSTVSTSDQCIFWSTYKHFLHVPTEHKDGRKAKNFILTMLFLLNVNVRKEIGQIRRRPSGELPKYCKNSTSAATCKLIPELKANVQKDCLVCFGWTADSEAAL